MGARDAHLAMTHQLRQLMVPKLMIQTITESPHWAKTREVAEVVALVEAGHQVAEESLSRKAIRKTRPVQRMRNHLPLQLLK